MGREWVAKYSGNWTASYKQHVEHHLEDMIYPSIGKRPIKSVIAPELLAVLRKIEGRGAVTVAHLAMRECGRIFRYAIATGRAERDVAADLRGAITPMRTVSHFASLTDPKVVGKLLLDPEQHKGSFEVLCALRLAPLVFVRAKELACAEWAHIDFDAAEWRIPSEVTKRRQTHIVPLSRQALAVLSELHTLTGHGRYLFPGGRHRSKANLEAPMKSISFVAAMRRLGYAKEEMTFHGFRSMASTLLHEQGYNRDWIERQLAHAERNGVRASYNHAEYLPERRKMMQAWSDYLYTLKKTAAA